MITKEQMVEMIEQNLIGDSQAFVFAVIRSDGTSRWVSQGLNYPLLVYLTQHLSHGVNKLAFVEAPSMKENILTLVPKPEIDS